VDSKEILRKRFRNARQRLEDAERRQLHVEILDRVKRFPLVQRAASLHLYLSMAEEVETRSILRDALSRGKRVSVPAVDASANALLACELASPDDPMERGPFGIEAPRERRPVAPESLELVLVPGVAFDSRGSRLGFGRGYYDRFLKNLAAARVGLAYECQISDALLPASSDDVPMDFVITERRVIARCNGAEEFLLPAEQKRLLGAARSTVERWLEQGPGGRAVAETPPEVPPLSVKRGAFVTLRVDGELRGCIGYIHPTRPLAEVISECVRMAASEDLRFTPLQAEELPRLRIEISILSSPRPLSRAEDVDVGRHGLIVEQGARRGLLLPQVAVEHEMEREEFLEHTCLKAGLSPGSWKEPETKIETFTAQVFGETAAGGHGLKRFPS
jgi:5,10-methenyltetrahydrofolate synthetase